MNRCLAIVDPKEAMAVIILLLLSCMSTVVAQPKSSNISLGSSLTPTGRQVTWLSPSGLYAFGFYRRGNGYGVGIFLAGVPQNTVVWTANRDDPPLPSTASLNLTADGRFILQSPQQQREIYLTDSAYNVVTASMLDNGNFVAYGSNHSIIWQSFDHPTDTILQGQRLTAGMELFSSMSETDQSTGIFRLKMQHDGNLVQYPVNTPDTAFYSYWSSATMDAGDNVSLNLDNDARLYLLNSTGANIKDLFKGGLVRNGTIYLMKIESYGILNLYSYQVNRNGNQSVVWLSSYDRCDPKGLCGINGYCVTEDKEAVCKCLPGFDNVMDGNFTAGCQKNFSTASCKSDDGRIQYTIQEAENTVWEDTGYTVPILTTREGCQTACLNDCNCEVAMFKDQSCTKYRLPLRYGRRDLGNSNMALIKVGISTSNQPREDQVFIRKKEKTRKKILIIGVSLIGFAFILLVISGVMLYKRQGLRYKSISTYGDLTLFENIAPIAFTFADIERITNNFKEEIGKGAFGTVYKGSIMLENGLKMVAVKRLDKVSAQGEQEFQTEMTIIGRTHHRNLVRLVGYCHDKANRLLIYEYMINGSLGDVLFNPEKQPLWNERVDIARNIARGLLYLHEECETQIIHCDIKSQNILMDENGQAKIADFGLAKLLKPDQTKTFTGIRGTRGYVAPEWHRKHPVTVKADVYSFGVVLLEIICCRRCVNWSLEEEEAVLEEWVYDCFQRGELYKLAVDEELVDVKQLERMVRVGLWCIQEEPTLRPSMKKVLLMLEGTVDVPLPPSPTSFLSAI